MTTPVPWTKLAWVTWRQHRAALAGTAALLGGLSLYLLIFGLRINSAYAKVASCHPANSTACQQLASAFRQTYWGGGAGIIQSGGAQTISGLLQAVPVLLGVFVGAPVLARELETGTFRFAWTQGCGRVRWTIAKLVLLAGALAAAAAAFSMLFSWYYHPFLAQGLTTEFLPVIFNLRGVDFAAWTLIAFTISAFAGAVIRRTVPAMAAALATWIVLDMATIIALRPHYEAALASNGSSPPSGWGLGQYYTGPGGQRVTTGTIFNLLPANVRNSTIPGAFYAWLSQNHYMQWFSYQPQSRFWTFQFIEGGWLLVLAVMLGSATIWLVRRRAA
jgi:hypothetical protein